MNLNEIDPALGSIKDFAKVTQGTVGYIQSMRNRSIFADGVLPAKTKALFATLWGVSTRCEPCLKFYVLKAKEASATEAELGEVLAIASTMGGCVGEMWALKAYHAFMSGEAADPTSCCA